jgi:hypothetical protein
MEELGIVPNTVILLDRPDEMVKEWCLGRAFDPTTGGYVYFVMHTCVYNFLYVYVYQ